jgi:hypothetical protein
MITHAKNTTNGEQKLSKDVRSLAIPFNFTLDSTKYKLQYHNSQHHRTSAHKDKWNVPVIVHASYPFGSHCSPLMPLLYFHSKVPSCPRPGRRSTTVHHGEGTARPGTETLISPFSNLPLLSISCS